MKIRICRLSSFARPASPITVWLLAGVSLLSLPLSAQGQASAKKKDSPKSVGFNLSAEATEKDLGLPIYPGSKPYKEDADSNSSLNVGFQGGSDSFKLAVMKLESADSPEKIAAFYRKALGKYGPVLDCSKPASNPARNNSVKSDAGTDDTSKDADSKNHSKSNALTCEEDDQPAKGGYSYRSGVKNNMHVVGIEPNGKSTVISLVYLKAPENKQDSD